MFSELKKKRPVGNSVASKWLIIGLGNPGIEYQRTRHNLGFMLVDLLASECNIQVKRKECRSLIGQTVFETQTVELVKPQTFMNLSGQAVSCLVKKDDRHIERIIVVVDDLALPFGTIRLRAKGSEGGHNGLRSITACLKTREYTRLRIGIQPEYNIRNARKFVLADLTRNDVESIRMVLKRSADAIRCVVSEGLQKAMSEFNG